MQEYLSKEYAPEIESRLGLGFSQPVQNGTGAQPASCTMGTGLFPEVKRPRRGVNHPPHLGHRLKKEESYASTPLLCIPGMFQGELYLLPLPVSLCNAKVVT